MYSLQSEATTSSGRSVSSGEPTAKICAASVAPSMPAMAASFSSTARSVGVAVGEERFSVSEINPAMSNPAVDGGMSTPCCW